MKQVWQCDYCDFTGSEEQVREHEENCKSCINCNNRKPLRFFENKIVVDCQHIGVIKHVKTGCDKFEKRRFNTSKKDFKEVLNG